MKIKIYIIFIFFLSNFSALSQKGILRGSLKDKSTQEGLPFANVLIKELGTGTTTDFEGNYNIEINEGEYSIEFSYVGYETILITNVKIENSLITPLSASLDYESELLESVVVTAQQINDNEAAILSVQRKSPNLLDGISSENFKKIGDSDAASAVKRVPGVSIQDGKYVYVRGLGDRYSKTILNGLDIPGLDPDRNSIQMDIFPTNLIKNVLILKSSSADIPADFTGGLIDIETIDFPEEKNFSLSMSGSYNPSMHFKSNFPVYKGGKFDWLGFDDGSRELPIDKNLDIPSTVDSKSELTTLTKAFNPTLSSKIGKSLMNLGIGISYGNQYVLNSGNSIGIIGTFHIKNDYTFYEKFENYWMRKDLDANENNLVIDRYQIGSLGKKDAFLSGLFGVAFKTKQSKYKLNLLHLQNGESRSGKFYQEYLWENSVQLYKDNLEFTQRQISNALVEGNHSNSDASFLLNWKLSPTISKVTDPDLRLTPFRWDEDRFSIEPSESGDPTRIWRYLDEVNLTGKIDLIKSYSFLNNEAKLKFGSYLSYKERDFEVLNYRIYIRRGYLYNWTGEADEILEEQNLWTLQSGKGSYINGNYEISNTYNARQENLSFYLSNEFSISNKFRSIIGLRAEQYNLYYTGQTQQADIVYDDENLLNDFHLFPSINVIYNAKEMSNIRFSFSRTIARPSFKEKSIAQIFDPVTSTTFIGNINILPTTIYNYDLRWEFFQEKAQMYSLSIFYKDFTNPIELVVFNGANPNDYTPKNVDNATVYGLEIEFRKNLNFISESLSNFKMNFNTSLIKSIEEMDQKEYEGRLRSARFNEIVENRRVLQGQSPFLVNLGLSYVSVNGDLDGSLNYNVQGKTLQIVGINYVPDVYTEPYNSLNLNINYTLGSLNNIKIGFGIKNLLNEKIESYYYYQDKKSIFSSISPKREIKFSVRFNF